MNKSSNATKVGALLAAIAASACCWLPLLLVGLGAGATGAGAVFESLRPYLMAATVLLLGAGFYFTYRRKTVCATDGSCASGPSRKAKAMLWGITVVALASFAFPYWSASRLADANADQAALGAPALEIPVDGMTCAACAVTIHGAVAAVPGVRAVKVDQSHGRVSVWTRSEVDRGAVVEAIRKVGYQPGVPVLGGAEAAPATRTAFIEVKGMVQRLGIT